jgi:arylsulfatase
VFRRSSTLVGIVTALFGAACGGDRPPKHVILITVDTLRADHLGLRIGGRDLTPALSELSASSVRFAEASSVASETSPAIAALMTGLLPTRTGVIGNRHQLPPGPPTLASVLASHGFRTAALITNPVLAEPFGFARGFDEYVLLGARSGEVKARGIDLAAELRRRLPALSRADRLFLWLHYFDPHGPYRPSEPVLSRLPVDAFGESRRIARCPPGQNGGFRCIPHYQQVGLGPEPSDDARDYLRRYAGEVVEADSAIAAVLETSELRSILEESVLVVTADHGEALDGAHDFFFSHGSLLTEDQIRVPLLVRARGLAPSVARDPASLVDVAPTILSLLELPPLPDADGRDLLAGPPAPVLGFGRREEFIRDGPWKLRRPPGARAGRLFDLRGDHDEAVDLSSHEPGRAEALHRELDRVRRRPRLATAERRPAPDRDEQIELRSLGYL